jgi:phage-related protein
MNRLPSAQSEIPLHWVGSSKKDLLDFPDTVKNNMGYALGLAQIGGKHPRAKPWKGHEPGVLEVVEDYRGDTFRVIYTIRFTKAVYVLHAFQKKSKSGIKTQLSHVDLIGERLKRAAQDHEQRYGQFKTKGKYHD